MSDIKIDIYLNGDGNEDECDGKHEEDIDVGTGHGDTDNSITGDVYEERNINVSESNYEDSKGSNMNDISDNNERYKKKKGEKIKPNPSDSNPKVKGDRGKKNKS